MLDFSDLPKPQNGTIDYFPGFSLDGIAREWEVWNKPKNCMFIRITCISGGAGGASGFPSANTTARGGGGGGSGSGAPGISTYPANFLPDRLYISAGLGGKGGASSTTISNPGGDGIPSVVSISPFKVSSSFYTICGSGWGVGGRAATASSQGGISNSGGYYPVSIASMAFYGNYSAPSFLSVGSQGGLATGSNGSATIFPTNGNMFSGAAGGAGGAGFAGGITSPPASQTSDFKLFQSLPGGVGGTADSPVGGNGVNGTELFQPFMSLGGSGGGSSFDGVSKGGDGGNGGLGAGGGGGGAGGTDGGGKGGDGGPGLVIIHAW